MGVSWRKKVRGAGFLGRRRVVSKLMGYECDLTEKLTEISWRS